MFPERRLFHQEPNTFNRIAVKETRVIIVAKVVWIAPMLVPHFAGFPKVDAHHAGHFIQPFEHSVE